MSTPEPLGVAFIEIEPVAAGFRAKTEAQIRTQLAGASAGIPPSPQTAAATRQVQAHATAANEATAAISRETAALERKAAAAGAAAGAEGRAATATAAHAAASRTATTALASQSAVLGGAVSAASGLNAPLAAAAAGAFLLFQSLQEADAFEEQMRAIEVATHATSEELERAADRAVSLGRDLDIPIASATDAARAINLLARSGFNLEESMVAAEPALLLATAAGEDLAVSVQLIDRLLDAFSLTAADAGEVADAVATGLKFTQGNASEFANALATIGPVADTLGLSLQDTITLVLQLSESGLPAASAAGSLRQAFLRLAAGGKLVNEGLAEINLTQADLIDNLGNLRPDAFVILADAMEHLNATEQTRVLTQIFSRRAALAAIRLVEQQREGLVRMQAEARATGTAEEEAAAKIRTFGGALDDTRKDAADFGRELGLVVDGPVIEFVSGLGDMFRGAADAAGAVRDLGGAVEDLGGGLGAAIPDIPFQDQAETVARRAALLAIPGRVPVEIGRGISAIVGKFRDGEEETDEILVRFNTNVQDHLDRTAAIIAAAAGKIGGAARAIPQTLDTQLAVAQATGTEGDELRILREQRANALERLRRNERRLAEGDPRITQQAVQDAANDVTAAEAAIDAILAGRRARTEQAAADAERRAGEIEQAADKRDRAFIDGITAAFGRRQAAVSAAARTEPLTDDITANVKLRNFLTRMIAATQERIQDVRAAGRSAQALVAELRELRSDRGEVVAEIARLQEQNRQQAAETRVEQAQLDLQILEARVGDDPTARQENLLAAAHQRVINALLKAQKLTKKRSVEWKRLQLEIEQERAAIRRLREASQPDPGDGDGRGFQQQAFEFLQAQQGFASNLASNLIPTTAAAGLVGGTSPSGVATARTVPSPFQRATATEATSVKGVTAGQANTTNALLREVLMELRRANRGDEHPEARSQRRTGSAAGDYAGGGTVGM